MNIRKDVAEALAATLSQRRRTVQSKIRENVWNIHRIEREQRTLKGELVELSRLISKLTLPTGGKL